MKLLITQLFNYNCGKYTLVDSFLTFIHRSGRKKKVGIKLIQGLKQYVSLEPFRISQKIQNAHGIFGGTQGWLSGESFGHKVALKADSLKLCP